MAKFRKKKRRINWFNVSCILISISLLFYLFISLVTSTTNTNLTMKIQQANIELANLQAENASINIEIQSLENKDRVYVIAEAADLNQIQDNIVSVVGE